MLALCKALICLQASLEMHLAAQRQYIKADVSVSVAMLSEAWEQFFDIRNSRDVHTLLDPLRKVMVFVA